MAKKKTPAKATRATKAKRPAPKPSPRPAPKPAAPRGAAKVAREVYKLVQQTDTRRAAESLGISRRRVQAIAKAVSEGRPAEAIKDRDTIARYSKRLAQPIESYSPPARKYAPKESTRIQSIPAATKAGQKAQEILSGFTNKEVARAMGWSPQFAAAWRRKILRGDIPQGEAGRTLRAVKALSNSVAESVEKAQWIGGALVLPKGIRPKKYRLYMSSKGSDTPKEFPRLEDAIYFLTAGQPNSPIGAGAPMAIIQGGSGMYQIIILEESDDLPDFVDSLDDEGYIENQDSGGVDDDYNDSEDDE